jgi:hypothetical protein
MTGSGEDCDGSEPVTSRKRTGLKRCKEAAEYLHRMGFRCLLYTLVH